jgi:hypothetical protein
MSVRRKYNIKNVQSNETPIQVYHENKMKEFQKHKTVDKTQLIKKLTAIENEKTAISKIDITERTPNECYMLANLTRQIKEIREQIIQIDDEKDLMNYFSNTYKYVAEKYRPYDINIQDFNLDIDKSEKKTHEPSEIEKNYREYVAIVDKSNSSNMILHDSKYTYCKECGAHLEFNDDTASMVCSGENCGIVQKILVDSQKPSYDDTTYESNNYAYKRVAHLDEKLSQAQAKETTDIPDEIYDVVKSGMGKDGITNMVNLTETRVRRYLKQHGFSKYYKHVTFIIKHLNGLPPINLTQHMEHQIKKYFIILENAYEQLKRTSKEFDKLCENMALASRKNFLPYNCVINRVCLGLGYYDVMQCFPLLKSTPNLTRFFEAWDILCNHLKHEYPVFKRAMERVPTHNVLLPSFSMSIIEDSGIFTTATFTEVINNPK